MELEEALRFELQRLADVSPPGSNPPPTWAQPLNPNPPRPRRSSHPVEQALEAGSALDELMLEAGALDAPSPLESARAGLHSHSPRLAPATRHPTVDSHSVTVSKGTTGTPRCSKRSQYLASTVKPETSNALSSVKR